MQLVIDRKFRGPTESANGGYACGLLASFMHGPAEVTLRLPPPLERQLEVATDGALELRDGGAVVAEAAPAELELEVPEPISFDDAAGCAARRRPRQRLPGVLRLRVGAGGRDADLRRPGGGE